MTELTQAQLDQLYVEWSALGAKRERERITRVLEKVLHFDSEDEKRKLFALITGEQK